VGGAFVLYLGGVVRTLNFLDDCSTSAIVEPMRET
jgi:bifunctional ADP-heptose synthase (sugar kinase/adenylyltransferase)